MKLFRVFHYRNPDKYVDVKCPGYWPMEIKTRAIKDADVFTFADYSSLRIKRLQ